MTPVRSIGLHAACLITIFALGPNQAEGQRLPPPNFELPRYATRVVQGVQLRGSAEGGVLFSRDGKNLLVIARDRVQLWNLETWKRAGEEIVHGKTIIRAELDDTASKILTLNRFRAAGRDVGDVKVWDQKTGNVLFRKGNFERDERVRDAALSPDGGRIAVAFDKAASVTIYDLATGDVIHKLEHGTTVSGVDYTPDGSYLVTHGERVVTWEAISGKQLAISDGPRCESIRPAIINDMRAIIGLDKHFILAKLSDHEVIVRWDLGLHLDEQLLSVGASAKGRWIATTCSRGTSIWDAVKKETVLTDVHFFPADRYCMPSFDPTETAVLIGGEQQAGIWNLTNGKRLWAADASKYITSGMFSPSGNCVAIGFDDCAVVWFPPSGGFSDR